MPIVWITMIGGQPPRSKHMTGLDRERVDWLHEQVAQMIEWDKPMGCPRVLPLYTAIVLVLFGLRHNMSPDVLAELFGCGSTPRTGRRGRRWRQSGRRSSMPRSAAAAGASAAFARLVGDAVFTATAAARPNRPGSNCRTPPRRDRSVAAP